MSANAYLQRVIKNSPSKLAARAAKAVHGVAATADNIIGHSARKTWNAASVATRMSHIDPTKRNLKFARRVQTLAANQAQQTSSTRAKAGLIAGGAALVAGAKKALQKPEDDVYYGSY